MSIYRPNKFTCLTVARGFSLIEVLVALLIFSIGVIGVAALQTTSLRSNHGAYLRTQAVQLAYDMADRMRANLDGVDSGQYDSVSGTGSAKSCVTTDNGCSAADMASNDHAEWVQRLAEALPSGQGTVIGAGREFNVTVMWDADRTGAAGTGCSGDSAVDLTCYNMGVRL